MIRQGAAENFANADAAGEEKSVDAGVRGEMLTDFSSALHEIDHASGKPSRFPDANGFLGNERRKLAGFENHGVAGEQRGNNVPD